MKNSTLLAISLVFGIMFASLPGFAATSALRNQPRPTTLLAPGQVILLPEGRRAAIVEVLPDGNLRSDLGQVITPEGIILEGEGEGEFVDVIEEPAREENIIAQQNQEEPKQTVAVPLWRQKKQNEPKADAPKQEPAKKPEEAKKPEASPNKPEKEEENALSLAQMLPQVSIVEPQKEAPKEKPKAPTKETPKQAPKKQPEKKAEPKPPAKSKTGQPLRIPEEAIKTGNLDFLEGCWQGTRPEYFSKRTIKECFCFDGGGRNGKRRIFDPINNRQCIGSARANLSGAGALSITSAGAACTDGERWGQAEMVCRNTGQHAPCSWLFKDANNGRQSYEIPFIKVEQCGR